MITPSWRIVLTEVFFSVHGQWFLIDYADLGVNRPTDKITPTYRDRYVGYFYLPDSEEIAYKETGYFNDTTDLLPSLDHPDNHHITQALEKEGHSAADFYFKIDTTDEKRKILIVKNSDTKSIKAFNESTERNTMLKLIIGMAKDAYGYDADKNRNDLTGNNKNSLSAKLQTHGISISDDTIRKYLKEAKELIKL